MAILRSIPNMRICGPADSNELTAQLRQAIKEGKPTYIRIGKKGEPDLFDEKSRLGIGKANLLSAGKKVLIISIGPIVKEAMEAREILKESGNNIGIATMGNAKPLDSEFLNECISEGYKHWITLEEHHLIGGLGSAITEWLSEQKIKSVELTRMIGDSFIHELGSQSYVRETKG